MQKYSINDLEIGLRKVGLKRGQIVYINPEIYKLGVLKEAKNKKDYFKIFFDTIYKIIGKSGTIVVNSYTFQTLRYNKKFIHESTSCTSGAFSEYVRKKNGSIRSLHPVFSVTAYGKFNNKICKNNSLNNYGHGSPYSNFLKLKGMMLNLGIDYAANPFSHVAEFEAGVPYCYNKFTKVRYFKNRKKIPKTFSTFVTYLNLGLKNDYSKLNKKLSLKKIIRSIKLGSGNIHFYSVLKYYNLLINELKKDQFFLLKKPPRFKKGKLPFA